MSSPFPGPVVVKERGWTSLDSRTTSELVGSSAFAQLSGAKLLSLTHTGSGTSKLTAGPYVGRAQCGQVLVEVTERVDGALSSLLSTATSTDSFKLSRAPSPRTELGELFVLLARQFVEAVADYVAQGRGFRYRMSDESGSVIGGRLDVPGTIRLRAAGRPMQAAFSRPTLDFVTDLNRVVGMAILELEQINGIVPLPPDLLVAGRMLSTYFDDCRAGSAAERSSEHLMELADALGSEQHPSPAKLSDLAGLASVVLGRVSFEAMLPDHNVGPRSWFLNLTTLFEKALREALDGLFDDAETTAGSRYGRKILSSGIAGIEPDGLQAAEHGSGNANPDLVMARGREFLLVGDAKYKLWTGRASRSDIYQLLVHAKAFDSPDGFLAYAGDRFEHRKLGLAVTGSRVHLFMVDVRNLPDSAARLAGALGVS